MSGSFSGSLLDSLAHPAQVNYLDTVDKASRAALLINANRKIQAEQLAGEAFQRSINQDGTPNQNALNQNLVAAGPGAALAAQESSQKGQTLDQDTFMTHMARLTSMGGAAMALASQYPNGVPQSAVNQEIDTQAQKLGMSPTDVAQAKAQFGPDPAANSATIFRNHVANLQAQQQLMATQPDIHFQPQGGSNVPVNLNPRVPAPPGVMPPQQMPVTLSPGEKVQTQPTLGAGGQPGSVPIGSRFDAQGNLKPPGWGLNNGKYPAQSPPATPAAAVGPASSPADGGQQAAANPPGFMPTEQPPGATAAINAGNAIYDQANAATTQKSQLLTMESDLSGISTGPLAEREARWNALAHQLGVPAGTMTADQVAKSEGFAKVAKQIALAQAGALGVGTDEKLTTTMGANPNRDLSKLGNQQIIAMLQGNADAIKARGVAYDQWLKAGNNPANANNFLTDFNKTFDPRVYQWGYQIKGMTREQKEAAYNAMPDKQQFRARYNDAVTRGLLNP